MILSLTGQSPELLILFAVAVFFSAVIRGYAGFGFSALTVSALSLVMPVSSVVPVVLALEVAASIQMVPKVIHKVDKKLLWLLLPGCVLGIPMGQYVLLVLDPDYARLMISLIVLSLVGIIVSGLSFEPLRGRLFYLVTGLLAGCANGAAAMGGLMVSSLLLTTSLKIETLRATLIALFFFIGSIALFTGLINGLVGARSLIVSLLMLPPLALGVIIGNRRFDPDKVSTYRRITIGLLTLLAVTGLTFALVG